MQHISLQTFKHDFRVCYGELSVGEIISNVDLIRFIKWIETVAFRSNMPLMLRPIFIHFCKLISSKEICCNKRLMKKIKKLQMKLAGMTPPTHPTQASLKAG